MKKALLILVIFLGVISMNAQDIVGTWNGVLVVPGGQLRVDFHITATDNGYSAKMDSPDQNAFGIPVNSTVFKDKELTIKMPDLDFVYIGKLKENDLIDGTLTQMGQTFDMDLKRKKEEIK